MMDGLEERLEEYIRSRGLRSTPQRLTILQAVFSSKNYFTVDDLCRRVMAIDKTISRATVYRSVDLFLKADFIRIIDYGKAEKVYDANFSKQSSANHLICMDCGRIVEFEDSEIEQRSGKIASEHNLIVDQMSQKIECFCSSLRKEGRCEHLIRERMSAKKILR